MDIDFQHIGGHQDDDIPFHHLDRMAQLNNWMDGKAKRYLQYLISLLSAPPKPSTIHKEGWSCWVRGIKAMTDPSKLIKREVYGVELQKWLYDHGHLHWDSFNCVDWEANGDALSNAPILFSMWATKHVSGICAVGKMMKIWKYWEDSACLSFGEPVKMTYHMVLCPCMEWMLVWEEAIDGLEAWMVEVEMDPDI